MKKDLLKLLDLTGEDILKILDTADQLKFSQKHGIAHDKLKGKTLAMIFEKNSRSPPQEHAFPLRPVCTSWADTHCSFPAKRARSAGASRWRTPPGCCCATVTAS